MTAASQIQWNSVNGKPIAVFEDHHYALIPWRRWHDSFGKIRLITIDHHCDTQEAFQSASCNDRGIDRRKQAAFRAAIDPRDEQTIEQAVSNLRNDEHIDAAIRSGILDAAFIVHEQNARAVRSVEDTAFWDKAATLTGVEKILYVRDAPRPELPMTYAMPDHRMVAIDPTYYLREDDQVYPWPDLVIESEHLEDRLATFEQILRSACEASLEENPYVLDVDMDAFRTYRALQPQDPTTFHRLIRGAVGITIARERVCCKMLWQDSQPLNTQMTERLMQGHLSDAFA